MKLLQLILHALLLGLAAIPTLASERGIRALRSLGDETRELKNTKKPVVGGGNNGKDKGENGGGSGNGGGNGGGPKRELSGRVIVSRKSAKKLQSEGKGKSEIARMRMKAKEKFTKGREVVMQSGKEEDEGEFQVIEVGEGQEEAFMKELMSDPDVSDTIAYAEPDYLEYPDATTPNDSFLNLQYHHNLMQSFDAWDLTTGSPDITIGICDTGLQVDHPDLQDNRLPGYHATTQTWEVDGGLVNAVHPHGTMCAGCAAATGNNGIGVAGVGWNIKHRPGRVSDVSTGVAPHSVLADCARKMCELPDVKVASVSYAGVQSQTRRDAATYCKSHGALMVNAAGNDNRNLSPYGEADADDLIVVGASDANDEKSGFSAYGSFVDVWAPGSAVWTTTIGSTYAQVYGTSFSCPLVAGLIALIWAKNPSLEPDQVESILKRSTDDVGIQGPWNTTYGRINSFKAVQAADSGTMFPTSKPTPLPNPQPTTRPTTSNPTGPPPTSNPTNPPPTSNPTNQPPGYASHDGTTPRCDEVHSFCTSGDLLISRANLSPTAEAGSPNTIDGCADGALGTYQKDESVERIEVLSVGMGNLQVGQMAKVKATVWSWISSTADSVDFYVTEGDRSPDWNPIGVDKTPPGSREQIVFSDEFNVTSTLQTVRVRIRYGGIERPCPNGNYDDTDDLVFVAAGSVPTSPAPTKELTPVPTSLPTPVPTKEPAGQPITPPPTLLPTKQPTNNPTTAPTNNPTNNPIPAPTNDPTVEPTPLPTKEPTKEPTLNPIPAPTNKPTLNPTVSAQPSPFTPEEYVLSNPPGAYGGSILRAHYFEVEGSDVWTMITDLQVTTYSTNHLQVYSKLGDATPYENVPCAWKLVAETAPGWDGGYGKRVFPLWNSDGFEPVVLPAGQKVSFYVVNMGTSGGIRGTYRSGVQQYSPWVTALATSPVGAVVMSNGQRGYANEPFHAFTSTYAYAMFGGVKLETMRPGSTYAPSAAPTNLYTPGMLESPSEVSTEEVNGLQFDVENSGSDPVFVNKFDVRFASAGTHHIEVWMREGSHKGSSGGCDAWNNWCGGWTKLTNSTVTSAGPDEFTSTSDMIAMIQPDGVSSFAIVSGKSHLLTKDAASTVVSDDVLTMEAASPIKNYYGNQVQTIRATDPVTKLFQGTIHYEVAHSHCAVLSKASWVSEGA